MEHSSPLAAMQPPSMLFGHCFRAETATSFPSFPAVRTFGPNSFNFKDLSMKKGNPDYFNVKPVGGSSPTASLAADLSQNFHIDQSPQLVTPRRSLFSANLFGPENGRDTMTTPPLPSSSPALSVDMMDMSPLPHKIPYSHNADMDLESPTADMSMAKPNIYIPSPLQDSPMEAPRPNGQLERKRAAFLRPSLMRAKVHNGGITKSPSTGQVPNFKFSNGGSKLSTSTSMSLSEMFVESPERPASKISSSDQMGPPRPRAPFSGMVGQSRGNGSPGHGPSRKNSNIFARPRKQSRRSLSMFEHPDDVMKQDDDSSVNIQSLSDMEEGPTLHLPHFIPEDQPDSLPRIESSVLVDIIDGKYNDQYDNIIIIDCRFEYEYEGGHINGAVNYNDKEQLAGKLFSEDTKANTMLVFHCEYSAHRAPIMAKFIRHKDRAVNIDEYPKLTYPEMYILDGGYSSFFAKHRSLCNPQNYVEMAAKEHAFACERGLGKVKQRSKLARAQTFAFGQHSPQMEDSPTGRCRNPAGDRNLCLEVPEPGRLPGRRMFSY
ncbi:cell division cycle- protein [Onygenales sp. PD_40]|nr:cell division cycle- protein [Onygenales sp. PD_40]KAK2777666.1 cell division cycle- protein [Emmonsiellopsis sp. PD_33]KAK2786312.1 cell division cycle- protein [Onygenales sp. PD_12]KAK2790740.1 cell division cycle- protein [Onygenales sp. PD_10]